MARPEAFSCPKFCALAVRAAKELRLPRYAIAGALSLGWDAANRTGEPTFRSAAEFEATVGWDGEEGALAALLVEERWLDALENEGGLAFHDFWDHAPKYVLGRRARELARRAKGKTLADVRRDAANARWATRPRVQPNAPESNLHANECKQDANGLTPITGLPTGDREGGEVASPPRRRSPARPAFKAPTIEEVRTYVAEIGAVFSAERFVSFYQQRGWRTGKAPGFPMKDWRAACREWKSRDDEEGRTAPPKGPAGPPAAPDWKRRLDEQDAANAAAEIAEAERLRKGRAVA